MYSKCTVYTLVKSFNTIWKAILLQEAGRGVARRLRENWRQRSKNQPDTQTYRDEGIQLFFLDSNT